MTNQQLLIIGIVLLVVWFLWSRHKKAQFALYGNPATQSGGSVVNRFTTDISGLVGSFEGLLNNGGDFTSRLGSFFGTMGT